MLPEVSDPQRRRAADGTRVRGTLARVAAKQGIRNPQLHSSFAGKITYGEGHATDASVHNRQTVCAKMTGRGVI